MGLFGNRIFQAQHPIIGIELFEWQHDRRKVLIFVFHGRKKWIKTWIAWSTFHVTLAFDSRLWDHLNPTNVMKELNAGRLVRMLRGFCG